VASEHRCLSSATPYIHPPLFPECLLVTRHQSPTRTNFIWDVLKEQIMVFCLFDVREMHGSSISREYNGNHVVSRAELQENVLHQFKKVAHTMWM